MSDEHGERHGNGEVVPGVDGTTSVTDVTGADVTGADGPGAPGAEDRHRRRASHPESRWRAILFAPTGDGQTRKRGSDAVRLVLAVIAVVVCWVVVGANSKSEDAVLNALTSPPNGVRWLVDTVWWVGTVGAIVFLAVIALLSRRRSVIRDVLVAGAGSWLIAIALHVVLGSTGGRPPDPSLHGIDLSFPVARLAATIGVILAAMPYLSRWLQRAIEVVLVLVAVSTVVNSSGTPVSVLASLAVGWGATALVHLVFGSPLGLPSSDEVAGLLADLGIDATGLAPYARQQWGVGRFAGHLGADGIDVSVYGRDASDAQLLAKTFRFLFYRDSGPTLAFTRRQQVEHEAYLTLMAERAGARVPEVLAAGPAGPANDALLVTRPPRGRLLSSFGPAPAATESAAAADSTAFETVFEAEHGSAPSNGAAAEGAASNGAAAEGAVPGSAVAASAVPGNAVATSAVPGNAVAASAVPGSAVATSPVASTEPPVTGGMPGEGGAAGGEDGGSPAGIGVEDGVLESLFAQVAALRTGGIAHGAISTETIVIAADGTAGLVDFRSASTSANDEQLNRDVAATLAAAAVVVGATRAAAAAARALPAEAVSAALPFLQRAALDPVAGRTLRGKKALLADLRERAAAAVGVDVPKLTEPRRVSWVTLLMVVGTLIGGWALIGVLVNVTKSWSTIEGARWGWVALVFVLSQAAYPSIALTTIGSVTNPLPFGRTLALEMSNTFVALAGGSMAVLAARVRFFQKQGYDATLAVSSGVLVSTASWIVKGALFLIALPIAIGGMHFTESPTNGGGDNSAHLVWLIILIVLAVAVLLGLVFAIPRWRRLAADKLRPKLSEMWSHLKILATHPRNLIEIFGGNIAAQIVIALALGAALHAFGDHLGLATLIVVLTLASMLGGVSPVPGGMGVVEAGMILGLTAAGVPQTDAVAATFVQRLFTAYLPPIWGWFVMVWLRKKEYL